MLISSRFVKVVSPLAMAIALAACGGGSGSFGESGVDNGVSQEGGKVTDEQISSIDLQASTLELLADGSSSVDITAIVKDSTNNALEGAEVIFSVDNNATLVTPASDDTSTTSTTVLTANGATPGTILTVTATSGLISKSIQVLVVAPNVVEQSKVVTSIELQADSNDLLANGTIPVTINAIAKNQSNNAINDAEVSFSVDNNATLVIDGSTAVLNPNGVAAGTVLNVTATSGLVTKTIQVTVIAANDIEQSQVVTSIDLQADSNDLLANGTTPVTIDAIAKNQSNNAIDDAVITFAVDNNATLIVDGNTAVLNPNGAIAGTVLNVTATSGLITKTIQVTVVAANDIEQSKIVSSIDLQSNSNDLLANGTVPVIITGIAKNQSNNAIEDAEITFAVDNNATLVVNGNTASLKPNGATAGTILSVSATSGDVTKIIQITVTEQADGQATDIEFSASSRLLPSDGTKPVTLLATAKDANNNAIPDANITFSVDNAATINTQPDQTGTLITASLTPGEPRNRTLNVTATSGIKSKTIVVEVVGTTVVIDGPSAITLNNSVEYLLKLKDSSDKPIAFETVELSSAAGNTINTAADLKTDASGEIAFTLSGVAGGTDTITATVLGATYEKSIEVSGDQFILSGDSEEVDINTNVPISFVWTKDGIPQANKQITISATRGIIDNRSVVTDSAGKASFTISSVTAGQTVISATSNDGLSTSLAREFIAVTPAYLNSQAEPSTIAPNTSSTIIAKIRDINDNPVKNKTIDFRLKDTVNGILSASTAVTDSLGRASVSYTAGNSSSAKDGVVINTFVQGYPTVANDEVLLTVGGEALRIVLGNDQLIATDEVFYVKKYGVIVTDSAGNPIKNQQVSFTITPLEYHKGFMRAVDTDGDGKADKWVPFYTTFSCVSEDFDNDGNLDSGEDLNGNGTLEPTHDATITNNAVTDDKGKIVVEVIYPKSHALWSKQLITAKTTVEGTEFVENTEFHMDILAADVNNVDLAPPNNPSPYGRSDSCFNTNDTFNVPITPQVVDAVTRVPAIVLEHDIWYGVTFTDALGNNITGQNYTVNSSVVDINNDAFGNFLLQDSDTGVDNTGYNMTLNYADLAPIPLYYKDDAPEAAPVSTDTTGPEIYITGNNPQSIFQGQSYFDAGATAIDDVDGQVTANVVLGLPINTNILGTQTIVYQATDAAGNVTSKNRVIEIERDTVRPVITLSGVTPQNMTAGDFYSELGATATDNVDGNISGSIIIDSSAVNTAAPGSYIVTYNVSDSSGNSAFQVNRVVIVNP